MASQQSTLNRYFRPLTDLEIKRRQAVVTFDREHNQAEAAAMAERDGHERMRLAALVGTDAIGAIVVKEPHPSVAYVESLVMANTTNEATSFKVKPNYFKRPDNWKQIALEYNTANRERRVNYVVQKFNLPSNKSVAYWVSILNKWLTELAAGKKMNYGRASVLDDAMEKELVAKVLICNHHGVPLTNSLMRLNLLFLMTAAGQESQMEAEGSFGSSWFQRFYARHDLRSRVCTTKMRADVPEKYDEKKAKYLAILTVAIQDNNVCDALIVGIDETNTQFVPSVKRTVAPKGVNRVRIIGVGKEKAQVTVTFGAAVTGDMLPLTQVIFGGTTVRCHPNGGRSVPLPSMY